MLRQEEIKAPKTRNMGTGAPFCVEGSVHAMVWRTICPNWGCRAGTATASTRDRDLNPPGHLNRPPSASINGYYGFSVWPLVASGGPESALDLP